ncbi:MAG: glycosyltransferase family 2 protein [Solirubrobacterales bacterium]
MIPNISIIVPIYNCEMNLSKTLDSILNQTLENIEILLVDAGSTDGSRKIMETYKEKDPRIKLLIQENIEVNNAINSGIAEASGNYIGIVYPNDLVDKNMYEIMCNEGIQSDCETVICDFNNSLSYVKALKNREVAEDNLVFDRPLILSEICAELLMEGYIPSLCNKIYKKTMLINNNIFLRKEDNLPEDLLFNFEVINASEKIVYIPEKFYYYGDTKEILNQEYSKNVFEDSVKLYECKLKYYNLWNIKSEEIRLRMVLDFMRSIRHSIANIFDTRNKDGFFQKTNYVYVVVNDPLVINSYQDYKKFNLENNLDKSEKWVYKKIGSKSIFLLSLFYNFSNKEK